MSAADYLRLHQARNDWIAQVNARIARFDALLSPTTPITAPLLAAVAPASALDPAQDAARDAAFVTANALLLRNTSVVNMLDGCALSIPCHLPGELPMGLMLWHGADRDDALLNLGLLAESSLLTEALRQGAQRASATALLNHAQRLPATPLPLFNSASTRALEQAALAWHPQPSLMQRAGRACAQLAQALAPHAQHMWVLCGPGNNGGDGLAAAAILAAQGREVDPDLAGPARTLQQRHLGRAAASTKPSHSLERHAPGPAAARPHRGCPAWPGLAQPGSGQPRIAALLQHSYASPATVLAVDLPSGLQADTGLWQAGYAPQTPHHSPSHQQRHTLSLLTLKPGLFTADGRDAAGQIWFDDLGLGQLPIALQPCAHRLAAPPCCTDHGRIGGPSPRQSRRAVLAMCWSLAARACKRGRPCKARRFWPPVPPCTMARAGCFCTC